MWFFLNGNDSYNHKFDIVTFAVFVHLIYADSECYTLIELSQQGDRILSRFI